MYIKTPYSDYCISYRFSLIMMYPMAWMLMTSFKSNADIQINKTKFFPEKWTIEGYRTAFEKAPIAQWFINSILVVIVVTAAVIITSTLIGYVFAKYEFKGKRYCLYCFWQR